MNTNELENDKKKPLRWFTCDKWNGEKSIRLQIIGLWFIANWERHEYYLIGNYPWPFFQFQWPRRK